MFNKLREFIRRVIFREGQYVVPPGEEGGYIVPEEWLEAIKKNRRRVT